MRCPLCGKDPEVNVADRRLLLETGRGIGREEMKRAVVAWLRTHPEWQDAVVYADELESMTADDLATA